MQYLVTNIDTKKLRKESFLDREFWVAPVIMIVPGVLNGSQGPLLYTKEENDKSEEEWNFVPLTKDHPNDSQGNPTSARIPEIINRLCLGFLFNTESKEVLKAEAWFDIERTRNISPIIYNKLKNRQPIEVSTGLHTTNQNAPKGSVYNGQPYKAIATNYKPDHLAIFEYETGACSNQDGCGININKRYTTNNNNNNNNNSQPLPIEVIPDLVEKKTRELFPDFVVTKRGTILPRVVAKSSDKELVIKLSDMSGKVLADIAFSDETRSMGDDHKDLGKGSITFIKKLKQLVSYLKSLNVGITYWPTTDKRAQKYEKGLKKLGYTKSNKPGIEIEWNMENNVTDEEIAAIKKLVLKSFPYTALEKVNYLGNRLLAASDGKELEIIPRKLNNKLSVIISFEDPSTDEYKDRKEFKAGSLSFIKKLKQLVKDLRANSIAISYWPTTDKREKFYQKIMESVGYTKDKGYESLWNSTTRNDKSKLFELAEDIKSAIPKFFQNSTTRIVPLNSGPVIITEIGTKTLNITLGTRRDKIEAYISFSDKNRSMSEDYKDLGKGSVSFGKGLLNLVKYFKSLNIGISYLPSTARRSEAYEKGLKKAGYAKKEDTMFLTSWNKQPKYTQQKAKYVKALKDIEYEQLTPNVWNNSDYLKEEVFELVKEVFQTTPEIHSNAFVVEYRDKVLYLVLTLSPKYQKITIAFTEKGGYGNSDKPDNYVGKYVKASSIDFMRKLSKFVGKLKEMDIQIAFTPVKDSSRRNPEQRKRIYEKILKRKGFEKDSDTGLWNKKKVLKNSPQDKINLRDPKNWRFSSSNVRSVYYNDINQTIVVTYKNNRGKIVTWSYKVSPAQAKRFHQAGSKGIWLWDNVKVRGKGNQGKHRVPARKIS